MTALDEAEAIDVATIELKSIPIDVVREQSFETQFTSRAPEQTRRGCTEKRGSRLVRLDEALAPVEHEECVVARFEQPNPKGASILGRAALTFEELADPVDLVEDVLEFFVRGDGDLGLRIRAQARCRQAIRDAQIGLPAVVHEREQARSRGDEQQCRQAPAPPRVVDVAIEQDQCRGERWQREHDAVMQDFCSVSQKAWHGTV